MPKGKAKAGPRIENIDESHPLGKAARVLAEISLPLSLLGISLEIAEVIQHKGRYCVMIVQGDHHAFFSEKENMTVDEVNAFADGLQALVNLQTFLLEGGEEVVEQTH